jgi:hypothetical protein
VQVSSCFFDGYGYASSTASEKERPLDPNKVTEKLSKMRIAKEMRIHEGVEKNIVGFPWHS